MLNVEWPDTSGIEAKTLDLLQSINARLDTPIEELADEAPYQRSKGMRLIVRRA